MWEFDRPGERSWQAPETLGCGRLPTRATAYPFPDEASALAGARERSPWFLGLDGRWRFRLRPRPEAVPEGFAGPELDDGDWAEVDVPGNWTLQGFDRPHYTNVQMPFPQRPPRVPDENPTGLYRRRFALPQGWAGRRVVLHFGGAESVLYAWLNGRPLGFAKDSRLPAEFDATEHVRGGENLLAAAVVRWSDASFLEDQDHWWMAGLHREVYVYSTEAVHLAHVRARADFDPATRDGHLRVRVHLGSPPDGAPPDDWSVAVRLVDERGRAVGEPRRGSILHRGNPYRFAGDCVELELPVRRPRPWSAESPALYRVAVSLLDPQGACREATCVRVGFRRVEVRERELRVNGRAVLVKGMNRHDFDETRGKAVPRDLLRRDVLVMKRFHVNAVRTAHYPNDPHFLDLCDELGLYVIDEANVESHAYLRSLTDDPRFTAACLDRVARMARRDENHPCVIAWSLGNESGYGVAHGAMAGWLRRYDPDRPLHYEGALEGGLAPDRLATDLVCPMYAPVDRIVAWARTTRDDRPLVLCEYSHAMGNSNGGLREYFEAFARHRGLQGGFVWDWVDQGILRTDEHGRRWWAYGGDFGDEPNDGPFVLNGMTWPDRTPKPALLEFARLAQPVAVEARDLARGRLRVHNRQDFSDLSGLAGAFEVAVDGRVVQRGRLPHLAAAPGGHADVTLPLRRAELVPGQEAHLTVRFASRADTPWAPRGSEVAWEQFALPWRARERRRAAPARRRAGDAPLEVAEEGALVRVRGPGFAFGFERATGALASASLEGEEILHAGLSLQLWRAPTDNDERTLAHLFEPGFVKWVDLGLEALSLEKAEARVRRDAAGVRVAARHLHRVPRSGAEVEHRVLQAVTAGGELVLEHRVRVDRRLADLPRVGVRLALAPGFERVAWLGRGPHESYADRKSGAAVGLWEGAVDAQHVPYLRPQENGNKTDVRWVALAREGGPGLLVAGPPRFALFEFSVGHYTAADLHAARHVNELERRPEVWLNLDMRQRGVGTGACGPDTLPAYRIGPGPHRFGFRLRAFRPGRDDPGRLAREAAGVAPQRRAAGRRR